MRRARHSCTTIQHSPHWLQWDAPNSPQNCAFPFDDHHPCNTPIIRPTPLTIPNGIRIHSAVLPHYTFRHTHTQTHAHRSIDGLSDMSVRRALTLAVLVDTERRANNVIGTPIRYSVQWRLCRHSVQRQYQRNFFPSVVEGESLVRYAT